MALRWNEQTNEWTEVPDPPKADPANPLTPAQLTRSQMSPEEQAAADANKQPYQPILRTNQQEKTAQNEADLGLEPTSRGGVVDAIGGAAEKVGEYFTDMFSQDEVKAATIDESKFQRTPDSAATTGYLDQGAAAGKQGQSSLGAATAGANQQRTAGTQAAATGGTLATGQRAQGNQALASQQQLAGGLQNQAASAQNRSITDADRARSQQFAALGGIQQFQNQGPGPSAAQAQLKMGSDAAMGQALALARSGRAGTNPAAERQAMFQNAATAQNLSGQQAQLRAQEEQGWRGQQLQAMGLQQQGLQGVGSQAIQAQGLNDQTALGYLGAANQASALGYNAAQGFGGLANQTQGNAQQYDVALQNAANSQQGLGNQMYLGSAGIEQQYSELAEKARSGDRDAMIALEKLKAEQAMKASELNAQNDKDRDSGILGMAASALGFLSDERSKTKIRELEGELARTYKALGGPPATAGVSKGGEASPALAKRDSDLSRDLDDAMAPTYAALGGAPPADFRKAKGISYEYKDPDQPGAAPGRQYGPTAQDLEKSPATAASVIDTPNGKMVDAGRLAMTSAAAIGDQQRKADEQQARIADLEKQVQAMGGEPDDKYSGSDFDGTIYRRYPKGAAA